MHLINTRFSPILRNILNAITFAFLKLLEDPRIDKTMIGFVADD